MTPAIVRRGMAVEACLRRFDGKPLDLSARRDCLRLSAHAVRHAGVATPWLKGIDYRSEIGAARMLKEHGFADLVEAWDSLGFARIAPTMTWQADIVAGPGARDDGPFRYALSVVHTAGASRTIAFGADGLCGVGKPDVTQVIAAWRII